MRTLTKYLLLVLLLAGVAPAAGQEPGLPRVEAVAITVSDVDQAVRFYADVLSFEPVSDVEVAGTAYERLMGVFGLRLRVVTMRLGDEHIELTQFIAPSTGRPVPVDSRSNDRWFQHVALIVRDMDEAYASLRRHRVAHASSGPQTLPDWNPNAGGIKAFYFKDPDGNVLEILQFPSDKGAAKWHQPTNRLFLGIDHTAIVVADTEASLRFYRDHLGFEVAGESENYGPEQEQLNSVFGARLRITGLKPPGGGPAIELLEYLAPTTGRPMPLDTQANDLWHWHVRLHADEPGGFEQRLRQGGYASVSPGLQHLPGDALGYRQGFMVRDPDGHAMLLTQRTDAPGGAATIDQ